MTSLANTDAPRSPRRRLGLLLWSAGTLGAIAVAAGVLPQLSTMTALPLPAPLWLIALASVLQSALLIALAVWGGVALTPALGLHAPAFEAAATRNPITRPLRPQILPGLLAGVLGGLWLFVSFRFLPTGVSDVVTRFNPPLLARMIYGGITEEVLLRWGLMTAFTWLAWRFLQGKRGAVDPRLVWLAIILSALLFGAGHLPVAHFLIGSLNSQVVLFVVGVNASFGVLFGWLYWRRGLESAMVAHAVTHLVSYIVTRLGAHS